MTKNDDVIRPAILWNDGRTAKQTEYLNTAVGKGATFGTYGQHRLCRVYSPENPLDEGKRAGKFRANQENHAAQEFYRLSPFGKLCTDVSDASGTLLFDVKNRRWSKEMLDICGIDESLLPMVYESYEPVGTLKEEHAKALGLSNNVKIAAGAGDNAAAAIGTGTVSDGDCNISLGTSGTVFISKDAFGTDGQNALHSFAHANGKYHLMGCMLSAASCNKWWCENILKTSDYAAEQQGNLKLGENPVIFLPYLMGERSPHNNPDARGVFLRNVHGYYPTGHDPFDT